jgi:hypothetical protein
MASETDLRVVDNLLLILDVPVNARLFPDVASNLMAELQYGTRGYCCTEKAFHNAFRDKHLRLVLKLTLTCVDFERTKRRNQWKDCYEINLIDREASTRISSIISVLGIAVNDPISDNPIER